MISNKVCWVIWCIFVAYSIFLTPKNADQSKSTGPFVKRLLIGPWHGLDPYVISLFYFLGVWPLVYTCILLVDGQNQPFNGGLAAQLSMVFGGFVLLPYFALRRSRNPTKHKLNLLVRIFDSKTTCVLLILTTIALLLFATIFGDFRLFLHEFHTNRFFHIMSIDFFVVSWLFPFLVPDDLKRRKMIQKNDSQIYFPLCFLPLIGPLIYLYKRKPLTQTKNTKSDDE